MALTCLWLVRAAWERRCQCVPAGKGKSMAHPEAEVAKLELATVLVGTDFVPVSVPKERVKPESRSGNVGVFAEARLKGSG